VAEVRGPDAALELVDQLDLGRYHLWHATRAEMLRRCGRTADAIVDYERAAALTANVAERRFLVARRQRLVS
jgi:RNA polymerase sigma-70 factor (ECF subfamily)